MAYLPSSYPHLAESLIDEHGWTYGEERKTYKDRLKISIGRNLRVLEPSQPISLYNKYVQGLAVVSAVGLNFFLKHFLGKK